MLGTIDRATAEKTLIPKPAGMYLVRLSNKIWGYTISVKSKKICEKILKINK